MIIKLEVAVSKHAESGPVEVAVVECYLKEFLGDGEASHEVGPDQLVVFELVKFETGETTSLDRKMVD